MEHSDIVLSFPIVEPSHKIPRLLSKLVWIGPCSTLLLALVGFLEIRTIPSEVDLHDVYIGAAICLGFFVLVDLLILYYFLSYKLYFSSDIVLDENGLRRLRHGLEKEQYFWSEISAVYLRADHSRPESDWMVVTKAPLRKPSRLLFEAPGYFRVKWSRNLLLYLSYSSEKETAFAAHAAIHTIS